MTQQSNSYTAERLMIGTILALQGDGCISDECIVHVYSNVLHNQSTTIYSDEALHHHVTINTMMISP